MNRPTDTGAKLAFGAEQERFQKWERSLNFKASDKECEWALKKGKQLDLAKLTKWPVHLP